MVWSMNINDAKKVSKLPRSEMVDMINVCLRCREYDLEYLLSQIKPDGISQCDLTQEASWAHDRIKFTEIKPPWVLDVEERSVGCFPLKLRHSKAYVAERIVLIGDAAHSVHPLAGQGLNLGLADAEALIKCIEYAAVTGQNLDQEALQRYGRDRYAANAAMLFACDSISRVFGFQNTFLRQLRGAGMNFVDRAEILKEQLIKLAS